MVRLHVAVKMSTTPRVEPVYFRQELRGVEPHHLCPTGFRADTNAPTELGTREARGQSSGQRVISPSGAQARENPRKRRVVLLSLKKSEAAKQEFEHGEALRPHPRTASADEQVD